MRAVPSSTAEPLHGALRNGFEKSRQTRRLAGSRMLRASSGGPVLSLPSDHLVERHQRCRLVQASLDERIFSNMERFRELVEVVGTAIDAAGVLIIVGGAILATVRILFQRASDAGQYYRAYRQDVGRAILLGLEFLIAGDIIRTVVVAPTMQNVLVLGLIVLIRTFLSLSLQLEIEGKLPWSREAQPATRTR